MSSLGSRFAAWWLRRRPVRWGWLLPMAALQVADDLDPHRSAATWLPLVVGCLAGAAWQVLYPRDLASRLTLFAVALLAAGVLQAFTGDPVDLAPVWRENWAAAGVLVGLVVATHAYRSRWLARLADARPGRPGPAQPSRSSSSASNGSRSPTQSWAQNGSQ